MAETKKFAMVVSEGSFDKAMMAMMMGNTAASMGIETHIYFTFFGLNLLKKGAKPKLPGMLRFFTGMMVKKMKGIGMEGYQEQLEMAKELGVKIYACSSSMEMMGIKKEDLIDGITVLGAAAFLNMATESDMQLFIG
ncbi:MAG TPA: DsrE/DsrF/DrsH-like family protein [Methanomassiliicoccales archaeon]|jgi:peroxiredoxin family protein|nr:DsrE/DsrF/DrsH-like family protein [Methanomassiliicoccales archaeon]HQQ25374.1 DsrE/DsrF/DrsH-like family protein [Methanomassiliicoccales archaeon]